MDATVKEVAVKAVTVKFDGWGSHKVKCQPEQLTTGFVAIKENFNEFIEL